MALWTIPYDDGRQDGRGQDEAGARGGSGATGWGDGWGAGDGTGGRDGTGGVLARDGRAGLLVGPRRPVSPHAGRSR
ncbi:MULTISPECIES: hypothetical protein [unclassified Streptomyces]|uniref:hypothetical protein n=1 Tax=unclassified Streptomyces TaxID=2593676 RepID=UPI002E7915EF|nr:hypothetical protein [Streptomyces sp. JV176]MEE1801420.1 hypothetical protein [Streptomyces sp. JV176]